MANLAMLADILRTVYPEEVTRQLLVMAQARESSPVSVPKEKILVVSCAELSYAFIMITVCVL